MRRSLVLCVVIGVVLAQSVLCFAGNEGRRPATSGPVVVLSGGISHRVLGREASATRAPVSKNDILVQSGGASFPGVPLLRGIKLMLNQVSVLIGANSLNGTTVDCDSWTLIKVCFNDNIPDEDKPACCFGHDSDKPDDE